MDTFEGIKPKGIMGVLNLMGVAFSTLVENIIDAAVASPEFATMSNKEIAQLVHEAIKNQALPIESVLYYVDGVRGTTPATEPPTPAADGAGDGDVVASIRERVTSKHLDYPVSRAVHDVEIMLREYDTQQAQRVVEYNDVSQERDRLERELAAARQQLARVEAERDALHARLGEAVEAFTELLGVVAISKDVSQYDFNVARKALQQMIKDVASNATD